MRTILLAVFVAAVTSLWPALPAAQQQPLAGRIVHTDPATFRQSPAVHGGAGSMGFTALLNRGAVTPEFNFLHRGVIPPGAGIGAHRCILNRPELMQDPWVVAHDLSATREHDEIGLVTTCGPAPRLSATPVDIGRPAPKPGSDAADILAEIGLEHRLDDLVAAGVIRVDGVAAG